MSASRRKASAQAGPAWHKLALIVLLLVALAAMWRYTPLADYVTVEQVNEWVEAMRGAWWAPIAVILIYTPGSYVLFPRPLVTLAAVIAFGPWVGFLCAITGIMLAALASYYTGRAMPSPKVRKLAGSKFDVMKEVLRRRGFLAVLAVRVVPVAPFIIVGIVAGALRVKLWHFALATLVGILPGTLTTTVFGDQLHAALEDPSTINYWLVAAVVIAFVASTLFIRRWFMKHQRAALQHQT